MDRLPMASSNFDASSETDDDLLIWMGWKGEYPDAARAAFGAFYSRHVEFILDRCR